MTAEPSSSSRPPQPLLGVDTGGTFTDFVHFDGARLQVAKRASTPDAPERAVIDGAQGYGGARVVHGSTVATNALLEGKTARTAYVANAGLADLLTIGRQARRELYALEPSAPPVPVPPELCLTVDARSAPDGSVVAALTDAGLAALVDQLRDLAPNAVAINLLYSFIDDAAERAIADALARALPAAVVCRSSAVLPEYREYERGIATWLNAALGPRAGRYLQRLGAVLGDFAVMHSAAGTVDAKQAAGRAVHLLLSGPAGGLLGAQYAGALAGRERLMTLDMGGTSTDVALIDGRIELTSEGRIGGYPVAVPMVDMHTIGAGGGSVAYIDAGGILRVGPESAGATPGPACYGAGGEAPTVTDANLVLGRLPASTLLGGELRLDTEAARRALQPLARELGRDIEAAAEGVIAVANEAMAAALRVISVRRGHDPRDFTLLSFGGAGPLHVCALAEALGMGRALVPIHAGVLSALGMLVAPRSRALSNSLLQALDELSVDAIERALAALRQRGCHELSAEGVHPAAIEETPSLDLRYAGQSFSLNVPWRAGKDCKGPALHAAARDFHSAHEARYGHRLAQPVEAVNLRLNLQAPPPVLELPRLPAATGNPEPEETAPVHGQRRPVPVYSRADLAAGQRIDGPAVLRDDVATLWLAPGWRAEVDDYGNLLLRTRNALLNK